MVAFLWKLLMVLLSLNLAVNAFNLIDEVRDRSEQIEARRKMASDVKALDAKLAALEERHGKRLDEQRLELERLQDEAHRLIERLQTAKLPRRKSTITLVLEALALLFCLQNKRLFAGRPLALSQAAT